MESEYRIIFYTSIQGDCPAKEFLNSLPIKVRAKISQWMVKLEEYGPNLPRPYADIIQGKIRELRVVFASTQYRLLYFFYGKCAIITHGFIKKTDEVGKNEIERACRFMYDFEERAKRGEIEL